MIIDTHAHVVPGTMLDALRSERRLFPSVRLHEGSTPRMEFAGGGPGRPIQPRLSDLEQRRDWLRKARVDHQLVGGWTDVYGYELPAAEGADWARFYNEHMARDAAALTSLTALATVPSQDGALAARVLEEALDAGFKGAMIATQPKGVGGNLDDPSLDPFWELASARKAAIFLHPHYICGDERLAGYDLVNAVAAAVLRAPDPLSGSQSDLVAWRRRAPLCARPAKAQPRDPPGLCRPGSWFPEALFRHCVVRTAGVTLSVRHGRRRQGHARLGLPVRNRRSRSM
jgi:hypothetical protein